MVTAKQSLAWSWRLDEIDQHHVTLLVLPVFWIFKRNSDEFTQKNSPWVIRAKTDKARNACCGTTTLPKLFIRDLWSSRFSLSRTSHLCMGVVLPAFHGRLAKWSIGGAWQWQGQKGRRAECFHVFTVLEIICDSLSLQKDKNRWGKADRKLRGQFSNKLSWLELVLMVWKQRPTKNCDWFCYYLLVSSALTWSLPVH